MTYWIPSVQFANPPRLATLETAVLTYTRLKELLHYDPSTGHFKWRVQRRGAVKPGDTAGRLEGKGYIQIGIDGTRYQAHRLAWFYTFNVMPSGVIDHINGIRTDNRISNLRDVSFSENLQNFRNPRKGTASGLLGVSKKGERWVATICRNLKVYRLGTYNTAEEAHQAYLAAKSTFEEESHHGMVIQSELGQS